MSSPNSLEALSATFSRLSTSEDKAKAALSFLKRFDAPPPIGQLNSRGGHISNPLGEQSMPFDEAAFYELISEHGVGTEVFLRHSDTPGYALDAAPCAFVNPNTREECKNIGKQICGECKLVKYCSQVCQRKHWSFHKQDCKDSIRMKSWRPIWEEEGRPPTFVTGVPRASRLSQGLALWGNMPAVDILNLADNELDTDSDFNVVFAASGDLRNVIKTVNSLPATFTGKLTVLLNDHDPHISLRNILLMTLLGNDETDTHRIADIALHLWYSAFLPMAYRVEVLRYVSEFAMGGDGPEGIRLGSQSSLDVFVDKGLRQLAGDYVISARMYDTGQATNELARVRFDPSRTDLHHRIFCRLEPSHRLSLNEFRKFGLVLPLGAHNAYFNTPNCFLFSPRCEWLLSDGSKPLGGWDVEQVIKSGIAHGTTREDVYGCLYFHVSDALREFSRRLSRFKLHFKLFNDDTLDLANRLRCNELKDAGLPATMRFERIDVSNIMDPNYAAVGPVVKAWGPLLCDTTTATMTGYFMNWSAPPFDVTPSEGETRRVLERMWQAGRMPPLPKISARSTPAEVMGRMGTMQAHFCDIYAYLDTSKPFDRFLESSGLSNALRQVGLKRKTKHTILPPRLFVPIHAAMDALPRLSNESWYWQAGLGGFTWQERFTEFHRGSA